MKRGYFRFWRMFRDDPEWPGNKKRKFTHFEARLDLYCDAKGIDGTQEFKGFFIPVKRGQVVVSCRDLAKRWRWGKSTVDRFLKCLEKRGSVKLELGHLENPKMGHQISKKTGHHFTIVTFLEYDTLNPLTKQDPDTTKFEKPDTTKNQKRDTFEKNGTPKRDTLRDTKPTEEKRAFLEQNPDTLPDTKTGRYNLNINKDKKRRFNKEPHKIPHSSNNTKTKTQKQTTTPFDKANDAGENVFQSIIDNIQAKRKTHGDNEKTIEGKQNAKIP